MKTSITIALVILLLGIRFGWHEDTRHAAARELNQTLKKAAGSSPSNPIMTASSFRHHRRNPEIRANMVLVDALNYLRNTEKLDASGFANDPFTALMERVRVLNEDELAVLVGELRATLEIDEVARFNFIWNIIRNVAPGRPETALELMDSISGLAPEGWKFDTNFVGKCIVNWSACDPESALKWMKDHEEKLPADARDELKSDLLAGTTSRDPLAACRMLGVLAMEKPFDAISRIRRECDTPELRSAALVGVREYMETIEDEKKRAWARNESVSWLAYDAAVEDFGTGSDWIASAGFTEGELTRFAANLGNNMSHVKDGDSAKWVQWVIDTLPADEVEKNVRNMVATWARADYRDAAEWIGNSPGGVTKNASISAYAEAVSKYEPESAVKWAESLPVGRSRDATFKAVHKNWQQLDSEAAAEFAIKHGVE